MRGDSRRVSLAVLDIDGVVADVRHRLHHLAAPAPDWPAFWRAATDDDVLPVGAACARELARKHDLVWLTGRPEKLRDLTRQWLADHELPYGRLLMHPGSYSTLPTRQFKLGTLLDLTRSHPIHTIVDDDPAVIDLLCSADLPVHLATWCPYQRAASCQDA